jgi:hypothetical protein
MGGACDRPVAARRTVSEVEVSLSTVMALKLVLRRGGQHRLQSVLRYARIGEDIGQHRRHVRRDHAGSLGDTRDRHRLAADIHLLDRAFREGVGRHDRARRRFEVVGMKT